MQKIYCLDEGFERRYGIHKVENRPGFVDVKFTANTAYMYRYNRYIHILLKANMKDKKVFKLVFEQIF